MLPEAGGMVMPGMVVPGDVLGVAAAAHQLRPATESKPASVNNFPCIRFSFLCPEKIPTPHRLLPERDVREVGPGPFPRQRSQSV